MRQANREEAVERIVSILADCDFDNQDFLPEDFKTEGHFSQFEKLQNAITIARNIDSYPRASTSHQAMIDTLRQVKIVIDQALKKYSIGGEKK